jgi:hypothetical protein
MCVLGRFVVIMGRGRNCLSIILLHVHPLLGNGLVNKFPRSQILAKQSVARLHNNSGNRRSVFNVVCAITSAKQQNCKHAQNNRCYPWGLLGQWRSFAVSHRWEAVSQGHKTVTERSCEDSAVKSLCAIVTVILRVWELFVVTTTEESRIVFILVPKFQSDWRQTDKETLQRLEVLVSV